MAVEEFLAKNIREGEKCAVMGIGSVLRSDDGAGMYFIELLSDLKQRKDLLLVAGSTAPENFTGVIKKYEPDVLFIIDAAYMGLQPGEIKVVPAADICGVSFSTHMLPLSVMLNYLESESGCAMYFIGIQPKSTEQGLPMSSEAKKGTKELAEIFRSALVRREASE